MQQFYQKWNGPDKRYIFFLSTRKRIPHTLTKTLRQQNTEYTNPHTYLSCCSSISHNYSEHISVKWKLVAGAGDGVLWIRTLLLWRHANLPKSENIRHRLLLLKSQMACIHSNFRKIFDIFGESASNLNGGKLKCLLGHVLIRNTKH